MGDKLDCKDVTGAGDRLDPAGVGDKLGMCA